MKGIKTWITLYFFVSLEEVKLDYYIAYSIVMWNCERIINNQVNLDKQSLVIVSSQKLFYFWYLTVETVVIVLQMSVLLGHMNHSIKWTGIFGF